MFKIKLKYFLSDIIFIIVILLSILFLLSSKIDQTTNIVLDDKLYVYFLDVGEADAILIRVSDENVLIDAGNNEDGPLLVDYFKDLGIRSFSYVIGTHAHEDHIGGMDDIIKNFDIGTFYMPNVFIKYKTFEEILDNLEKKKYKFDTPNIGDKFNIKDATFEIIYLGEDKENINSTSIVIRLDYGNISFLFTGDITKDEEKIIIDKNIDVDVLKVAHHGSAGSSSYEFINKVAPKYSVIEVGVNNDHYHPSKKIIKRLEAIGSKVFRTDLDGTIIMEADGNDIGIKTIKTNTNKELKI